MVATTPSHPGTGPEPFDYRLQAALNWLILYAEHGDARLLDWALFWYAAYARTVCAARQSALVTPS